MPDARVESTSIGADGRFNARSLRDTQTANERLYGAEYVDPVNFRRPEMMVYIYSVVDQRPHGAHLHRSFPPLVPHLSITELKPGERYAVVTKIPHPVNQQCMRENGERYIDSHDARRVAMDIVNPDNLTLNQDTQPDPAKVFSQGNDYGRLGVFWSLFPEPTDEEISKAVARKEAYYRARLQQARMLEMTNPKGLAEYITINDHIACDYFGEEYSWHRKMTKPSVCPNCGESMATGAAFHKSLDGILCISDWKRAVDAGVKSRSDVPPEKRWWKVEKEPKEQSSRSEESPS
jgi:hypothetical protein